MQVVDQWLTGKEVCIGLRRGSPLVDPAWWQPSKTLQHVSLMTGCTTVRSSQLVLVGYLWKSSAGNPWEELWWAGRRTALSEHMDEELQWAHSQSCHSCFRTEIKAADFPSSDVYSRIRRKLLVIQTPASYFDGIAVPDKGIGPLFFHLKAVSLGMQRLFHFFENHSFFCWRITTIACSYFILRWNAAETEGG